MQKYVKRVRESKSAIKLTNIFSDGKQVQKLRFFGPCRLFLAPSYFWLFWFLVIFWLLVIFGYLLFLAPCRFKEDR